VQGVETAKPEAPMTLIVNGKELVLKDKATVLDLLEQLSLTSGPVAVEVNQVVIPRAEHGKTELHNGDRVEIVTLVGGG